MNTNSENPGVGKKFQNRVLSIARERFGTNFIEEHPIQVGKPAKNHRFDVVSEDNKIVIECKCYTWTNGNNVPIAKMATLNAAVLYMLWLPEDTHKIFAMKKDVRHRTSETLAGYYCRTHGHLLGDIEVWEIDEDGNLSVIRKMDGK